MVDDPSSLAAPDSRLLVSVIIPARNEAAALAATLQNLLGQRHPQGGLLDPRSYEVIVLANNCTDETADLARWFARRAAPSAVIHVAEQTFPAHQAHVGTARKWLMDLACRRLDAVGRPAGLIASTDADTQVEPTWIAATLAEVAAGAEAVAGLIRVNHRELRELGPQVRRAYWLDRVYRRLKLELEARIDPNPLDPYPRHDFQGGASLAITSRMYRRVGGLPPLATHEDVALAAALWRVDARFVHSPRVRVTTSSRLVGRAAGGHSQALSRWALEPEDRVRDVQAIEAELWTRRQLRWFFAARIQASSASWHPDPVAIVALATRLGVEPVAVVDLMRRSPYFGTWLEAIQQITSSKANAQEPVRVPISTAIAGLLRRLRSAEFNAPVTAFPKDPRDTALPPKSLGG